MKERPIFFKAEMVNAILEGRKTQTRRVVKEPIQTYLNNADGTAVVIDGMALNYACEEELGICPYGAPDDRLWVRETWKPDITDELSTIHYRADGHHRVIENTAEAADRWMKARRPEEQYPEMKEPKWRPSIFMARWMSRIDLEITAIRVERLNEISEVDATAEGVEFITCCWFKNYLDDSQISSSAKHSFVSLW